MSEGIKNQDEQIRKRLAEQHEKIQQSMGKVKHKIVVFSGKGGVGKTTVAVNLSYALNKDGFKVGLMDADITGPNVPQMTGLNEQPNVEDKKMIPKNVNGIKIISMANLIPDGQPVIWMGPLRANVLTQFITDVNWGELDYLVIDLPPGTGDEILTSSQKIKPDIAVIVSTPQELALIDFRRAVNMAKKMNIRNIGIIENFSYYTCPHCKAKIELFGPSALDRESRELGVFFLGKIPGDIQTTINADKGKPILLSNPESEISQSLINISKEIQKF